jgi:hypothetical protein
VPAEDMMQAFFYRHLVPAEDLKLTIRRGNAFRAPLEVHAGDPLKIPSGGKVEVPVLVPVSAANFLDKVLYELSAAPSGVELKETIESSGGAVLVLACDAQKAKIGERGNLIFSISAERKTTEGEKARVNRQRIPLGALPAVPFEIVAH